MDADGSNMLADLAAAVTIRASASGCEAADRSVTARAGHQGRSETAPNGHRTAATSLRFAIAISHHRQVQGCACTAVRRHPGSEGGTRTATITRTSGTCSWQASTNVGWITFPGATSGNGSGTLTFVFAPGGLQDQSGNVTISWTGGSFNILVQQVARPEECRFTVSITAGDVNNIPSAGGQFTLTINVTLGLRGCPIHTDPQEPWIALTGGSDTTTVMTRVFTVAPNPTKGTSRSAGVLVTSPFSGTNIIVTQR